MQQPRTAVRPVSAHQWAVVHRFLSVRHQYIKAAGALSAPHALAALQGPAPVRADNEEDEHERSLIGAWELGGKPGPVRIGGETTIGAGSKSWRVGSHDVGGLHRPGSPSPAVRAGAHTSG